MDALTALVDALAVGGLVHCRVEASAPWGMAAEPDSLASFHAIRSGRAVLRVDGRSEPIALAPGDVVLVAHGTSHAIVDRESTPAVRFADELRRRGLGPDGVLHTGGGGSPHASIVCGGFRSASSRERPPILSLLPPLVHVRTATRARREAIESTLVTIEREMSASEAGGGAIVTRLVAVLFVQLLREWLDDHPEHRDALLGSMTDPAIARALALVHGDSAKPWSVAELARKVGMSRSSFAARFTALVGEAPLRYVARVRLQRAAICLRAESIGVAEVARRVGYDSEAAFSRAFKRQFGAAPAEYRRALPSARQAAVPPTSISRERPATTARARTA
jgi:AraC-like DNA-binding protein